MIFIELDFYFLYTSVFDWLGEFFGILSSVAFVSPREFFDWAIKSSWLGNPYDLIIEYTNLFSGALNQIVLVPSIWQVPGIGLVLGFLLGVGEILLFTFFDTLPMFMALPLSFICWHWWFVLLRWLWSLLKFF